MKKSKWLSLGLAAVISLSPAVPLYAEEQPAAETSAAAMKARLTEEKKELAGLEAEWTEESGKLDSLKSELSAIQAEEKSKRAALGERIRANYESSPESGSLERLFVSNSSSEVVTSSYAGAYRQEMTDEERLDDYTRTFNRLEEKREEVSRQSEKVRENSENILAQREEIESLSRSVEEQETAEAAKELARKQQEAGTLEAVTVRQYLGNFRVTAYCPCEICCGPYSQGELYGYTASGKKATAGNTVAMGGVPFGTKLEIDGHVYTVEDRGTPYGHVDVFYNTHSEALNSGWGGYADVYLLNE